MNGEEVMNQQIYSGRYEKACLVFVFPKRLTDVFEGTGSLIKRAIVETCRELEVKVENGKLTSENLQLDISYPASWLSIEEVVKSLQSRGLQLFKSFGGDVAFFSSTDWLGSHLVLLSNTGTPSDFLSPDLFKKKLEKESVSIKASGFKCLVTGGAGFIGSNLADELLNRGHQVVILDSLVSGRQDYINSKAKFYKVDICDTKAIEDIFAAEKFDYVFHLAAQIDVRKSVADPEFDARINVFGGLNIIESSIKNKVKKIFFSSTGGAVYGGATEIPTTESYPTNPLSPYGIHKLTFEKYLNYANKVHGIAYTALRFANVYGQRQYKGGEAGVVSIFVDAAVTGRGITIYGDGLQTRDYVYVGDIVRSFLLAMDSDFVGFVNIGTGKEVDLLTLVSSIEQQAGIKMEVKFEAGRAGEERRSCLSYELAKKVLGWEPTVDFQVGLARTIAWSREKLQNSNNI